MNRRLLALSALLCAFPARGDTPPDTAVVEALTPLDAQPSKVLVDQAFRGSSSVDRLLALANDSTINPAVQIRAIRMLPQYCPQPDENCAGTTVHDGLRALVQGYVTALRQAPGIMLLPLDLLRLRAAVEALGVTRSELSSDVDLMAQDPRALLHYSSRDLRVTVVRALRNLRSCAAIGPLQTMKSSERNQRIRSEILAALQGLTAPGACR